MSDTRRKKTVIIAIIISVVMLFVSCGQAEIKSIGNFDDYISRYNENAELLGFSRVMPSKDGNGVYGFVAFDVLFIVALCTNESGCIQRMEISTGSSYAKTIKNDDDLYKAVKYASLIVQPLLYGINNSDDEISLLAGKILYSSDHDLILGSAYQSDSPEDIHCRMRRTENGGLEIILCASDPDGI